MTCNGPPCIGYENDGVCNVPEPCNPGSDCADCMTLFPTLQLAACATSFVMLILLLSVICSRLCHNQKLRTDATRKLLRATDAVDPTNM